MIKRHILRRQWLATYEQALVSQVPELAGKVDWDAATYLFNAGLAAREAADRMAKRWHDHDTDA